MIFFSRASKFKPQIKDLLPRYRAPIMFLPLCVWTHILQQKTFVWFCQKLTHFALVLTRDSCDSCTCVYLVGSIYALLYQKHWWQFCELCVLLKSQKKIFREIPEIFRIGLHTYILYYKFSSMPRLEYTARLKYLDNST